MHASDTEVVPLLPRQGTVRERSPQGQTMRTDSVQAEGLQGVFGWQAAAHEWPQGRTDAQGRVQVFPAKQGPAWHWRGQTWSGFPQGAGELQGRPQENPERAQGRLSRWAAPQWHDFETRTGQGGQSP